MTERIPFLGRFQMRIAVSYIAVILFITIFLNTYPIFISQQFVYKSKYGSMSGRAAVYASTLAGLDRLGPENVGNIMAQLDDRGLTGVAVTDGDGNPVYERGADPDAELEREPSIGTALLSNDVFVSKFEGGAFRSGAAAPVTARGSVIGAVYLYEYDAEQGTLLNSFRSNVLNLSIATMGAVLIVSFLLSGILTRRVAALLRVIRLVREGEYGYTAPVKGRDELAELAREFNMLIKRIRRTEELRRQFVSDASHELKTPLASMRLLADSIIQTPDMTVPELREFVSDMGEEIDRLTSVTEKLMLLTRLDARAVTKKIPVNLSEVAARAARMSEPLASQKGVTIRTELSGGVISADPDDAYRIVFNLCENAVKYNRKDGEVAIYLFEDAEKVTLMVDDEGSGIPEEEIPRLFERFYRADKARTGGGTGGAGLGLAIVKELVKLYNGAIEVKSGGKGTRFIVTFPKG